MKAPFKKVFLARYVQVLEVIGFLAVGCMLAAVGFSTLYPLDDVCKASADEVVKPHMVAVALAGQSYVRSVHADYGDAVTSGQVLMVASPNAQDAVAAAMLEHLRKAVALGAEIVTTEDRIEVVAPIDGVLVQGGTYGIDVHPQPQGTGNRLKQRSQGLARLRIPYHHHDAKVPPQPDHRCFAQIESPLVESIRHLRDYTRPVFSHQGQHLPIHQAVLILQIQPPPAQAR